MSDKPRNLSRRDLIKGAGLAGAAAVFPAGIAREAAAATPPAAPPPPAAPAPQPLVSIRPPSGRRRRVYENLSAEEARTLEAVLDRLIPTDDLGPGAMDSGALDYIDRGLGGALAGDREEYRLGLAAMDRYCRYSRGSSFVDLPSHDQDSVLMDLEGGSATGSGAGFTGSSAAFFGMIKGHTWQGMFGDPYYGGNADFAGWRLINYPGVRTRVTDEDQKALEADQLPPNYQSAYDYDFFEKATVQRTVRGEGQHAD